MVLVARVLHLASVALWVLGREVPLSLVWKPAWGNFITVLFHVVLLYCSGSTILTVGAHPTETLMCTSEKF